MFHFAEADQTDLTVLRRQGGLAIEYTKADFAVTSDIPLLYAAVLKEGKSECARFEQLHSPDRGFRSGEYCAASSAKRTGVSPL